MAEGINTSLFADASLQCYYRFNSGALTTDSKGSLTLTSNGSPTDVAGKFGNGVYLDTSAYFSRSTALTANGDSWSINMWVKDHVTGAFFSANSGGYECYVGNNLTDLYSSICWSDSTQDGYSGTISGFDATDWNMVTITTEQSGGNVIVKGYVNTEIIFNQTKVGKTNSGLFSPFYFSYYHVEGKNTSAGKIDDFMFFKNKVLTTTEIEQLYNETGGSFIFNMI